MPLLATLALAAVHLVLPRTADVFALEPATEALPLVLAAEHQARTSASALAASPRAFLTDCPATTGRSAALLLPSNAAVTRPGGRLAPGDEIAVVSPDGTCAGIATWTDSGAALAIWADDPYTPAVEGLVPGVPLQFMVRDAATGTVYTPEAVGVTYAPGYDAARGFQVDGLYVVASQPVDTPMGPTAPALALEPNHPNPFRGRTTLPFSLSVAGPVVLEVFDALGRTVARPVDGDLAAGNHSVTFDANGLASGVYVYRLQAEGATVQRRLMVAR